MTLRTVNQMTLSCDDCGTVFDDRPRGQGDQLDKARLAGWYVPDMNGPHWCPICNEIPSGN